MKLRWSDLRLVWTVAYILALPITGRIGAVLRPFRRRRMVKA